MTGPLSPSAREAFQAGVRRFDSGAFFEAHERFEEVWRSPDTLPGDRAFWKGVTQVAVALCHVQRGNARGAVTLGRRAVENLELYPSPHLGVDTSALLDAVRRVAVVAGGTLSPVRFPAFPLAR